MTVPTLTKDHRWSLMLVVPVEVLADEKGQRTPVMLETDEPQEVVGCFDCDLSIEQGWGKECAGT